MQTAYQQFIYKSRYARWVEEESRREDWNETVDRYMNYVRDSLKTHQGYSIPQDTFNEVRTAILNLEVLPSMRALMTAGPAAERNNIAFYNCAYVSIDDPRAFDEMLLVLMHGTGVGYSVENKFVSQLPTIPEDLVSEDYTIRVDDSKEGWAIAYRELVERLYAGYIPLWDTSGVREAGARLRTFGGRASGPEPLEDLFAFTVETFRKAAGRKLRPVEAHGIACKIGEIVVVGGVRRSALICLTDLYDEEMRDAKAGEWWNDNPHFRLANNSVAYDEKPSKDDFWAEWNALAASGSGERGIFSRYGMQRKMDQLGRDNVVGSNPCAEIFLRSQQFCNLSTMVIDDNDSQEDLYRKARLATILGTWQSAFTNFEYLRPQWKENCEEERLLGVSMTGIFGNSILNGKNGHNELVNTLTQIRAVTRETNNHLADALGINRSKAITCIKPEGTTSQLTARSSGMHPWHAEQFIRSVRGDNKDPMTEFLKFYGVYSEPDIMAPDTTTVFFFPEKAPEGAVTRDELTAIDHLELWATYSEYYTDHNPSITVNVDEDEWDKVGEWVYENFDRVVGVSFLPKDNGTYKQAPYSVVGDEEYDDMLSRTPSTLPWDNLQLFEQEDHTKSTQSMACTADGGCEVTTI